MAHIGFRVWMFRVDEKNPLRRVFREGFML